MGHECGRGVREGLSHEGCGGFRRIRQGREWAFQEEGRYVQQYLENLGACSGNGLIPFAWLTAHCSDSSPSPWPCGWVLGEAAGSALAQWGSPRAAASRRCPEVGIYCSHTEEPA